MLNEYLQHTQRLIGDQDEKLFNIADLTYYVNHARNRIAADGQCVRVLPPSTSSFISISVAHGGSGYISAPTVVITAPDGYGVGYVQAAATATISGGVVTGVVLTNAGTGYVAPNVTLVGGGGSGASVTWALTPALLTTLNQEVYPFSAFNSLLPTGVASILAVQSIAVSWGSEKPVLRWMDWSGFQAYLRSQNIQSTNWPAVWSQYGQGANGSVYLYPIPSQVLQMDWDCYCIPSALTSDSSIEAVPYPWTSAVPYYAAYQAMASAGNIDRANYFEAQYYKRVKEARVFSSPAMVPDFYGGPF